MTVDCEREAVPEIIFWPMVTDPSLTTPAGVDAITTLTRRRRIASMLNVARRGNAAGLGGFLADDRRRTPEADVVDTAIIVPGIWNAVGPGTITVKRGALGR